MTARFSLGDLLTNPKPRPFQTEDRHKFSPQEEDFDRISSHNQLDFECNEEYRHSIAEIVWIDLISGDPKYYRKFLKENLDKCGFSWPWLSEVLRDFDCLGSRPNLWDERERVIGQPIPLEREFSWWVGHAHVLTRSIADMRSNRNLLQINPEYSFFFRFSEQGASEMELTRLNMRNTTLMRAIMNDDLEDYLSTYPNDHSVLDFTSKR